MSTLLDLTGQRFGRWTALYQSMRVGGNYFWWCRCDCGIEKNVGAQHLRSGATQSCGCLSAELSAKRFTKHGQIGLPEYKIWQAMRQRCTNPRVSGYLNYGGREITVCPEWSDFSVFFADMGSRPSIHSTIERRDNDQGYSANNCYWATRAEQNRNRRNNIWVRVNDRMMVLADALPKASDRGWFHYYQNTYKLSIQEAYERTLQPIIHPNASKTQCPQGHPYDVNTLEQGKRHRRCSICVRAAKQRYKDKIRTEHRI